MKPVIIIGLGGIGGHLIGPLAAYLAASGGYDLLLIDGDRFERSNADRQAMERKDEGMNKADAHAHRLRERHPSLTIRSRADYLGPLNCEELIGEGSFIFLCVDNHATRKLVSDRARRLRDVLLLSAGNDLTDGNVQAYLKRGGRSFGAPLDAYHEEIRYPRDRNPAELSCEELAARPGGGQIVFANLTAAALALNAFYAAIVSKLAWGEVYFDILSGKTNAVIRHPAATGRPYAASAT